MAPVIGQFGIIDTIVSRLKLCQVPTPHARGDYAMCPLIRVQVSGCPTVHLPFLSPEEVDKFDVKVKAGFTHPPITVEESYVTGKLRVSKTRKTRGPHRKNSGVALYRSSSDSDLEINEVTYYDKKTEKSVIHPPEYKNHIKELHRKINTKVRTNGNTGRPKGYLSSVPSTKRNFSNGRLPNVKLNRASFLRNVSSDPELDKQMQKEIEKKLKEREKENTQMEITQVLTRRQNAKSVNSVNNKRIQRQFTCSSQQTDFLERIDEETMVGDSLQTVLTFGSLKTSSKMTEIPKSTVGPISNDSKSTSILSKRRDSMEPIINIPVPSSYGSSQTEFQKELSQLTKDSDFGQTFTITSGNPAENIRNASELDVSSMVDSEFSRVLTKHNRRLLGRMGSFNSYESMDRRDSFSQIEEQTEDGEDSIEYAEEFEEVVYSDDDSVCEEIIDVESTNDNKGLYNPKSRINKDSQVFSQIQKLGKIQSGSINTKMLTVNRDTKAEEPIQILGSSGSYSTKDVLQTPDQLLNASETVSLGEIIENFGGIDYSRDSSYSSSFSKKDLPSSDLNSGSERNITVKMTGKNVFDGQNTTEKSPSSGKKIQQVLGKKEMDEPVIGYADRYNSKQSAISSSDKNTFSDGKKHFTDLSNLLSISRDFNTKQLLKSGASSTKETELYVPRGEIGKNQQSAPILDVKFLPPDHRSFKIPNKAEKISKIAASKTNSPVVMMHKPNASFVTGDKISRHKNELEYQRKSDFSSTSNLKQRNQDGGDRKPDGGDRKPDGEDRKPDGGDRNQDGGDRKQDGGYRKQDGRDRKQDGGDRKQDGGDRKPDGGDRNQDGRDRNQDGGDRKQDGGEEDTVSDISTKIKALCSSSVVDKLKIYRRTESLSSVSSYMPSDDGSMDDFYGIGEEEFICEIERELGLDGNNG
ncbi:hypothetical protein FHG87_023062 [Trinorchestia longiramus]|nr:hypothetical protein FHG87_023062 [Trinorchestia longiramus]